MSIPLTCFQPASPSVCGSKSVFCSVAQALSAQHHVRHCKRSRGVRLPASARGHSTITAAARGNDPFVAASSRLQSLLSGVGDGEEELLDSVLAETAPEFKLGLSLLAGGVISSGALVLCWLIGSDPWGGASLSFHSLTAATLGAAACVPLLMLRAWAWSREASYQFPVLADLQKWQAEEHDVFLKNTTPVQMAVLVCCDVLPSTMLTLPAAQGGLTASFQLYANHMQEWGMSVPEAGPATAALAVTALLAALARLIEHGVTQEEFEVVATAMDNADRFYKVMTNRADDAFKDPDSAAEAFKVVASQWLQQRSQASLLLATLTAGEVLFLGVLWRLSNDMAAPLAASIMMTAVDFAFIKKLGSKTQSKREN